MDGPCLNDCVWKKLVEAQLFSILSYGSHLWNLEKKTVSNLVDVSYRKGIRRGIGLRQRVSVRERLGDWFVGTSVQVQKLYMKRALDSTNTLVRGLSLMAYRDNYWLMLISRYLKCILFALNYSELKSLLLI